MRDPDALVRALEAQAPCSACRENPGRSCSCPAGMARALRASRGTSTAQESSTAQENPTCQPVASAPPVASPEPPTPTSPAPIVPLREQWNGLLARWRRLGAGAQEALSQFGRTSDEYQAMEADLAALKVEARGLGERVQAELGREMTEDERRRGFQP